VSQIKKLPFKFSPFEKWIVFGGLAAHLFLLYRFQSHMGDYGDFVKAGQLIWDDKDPYSRLMYVNSPVSATLVYGLSWILPFLFVPFFWQVLNMLGIWLFLRAFINPNLAKPLFIAVTLASFFNSTRALYGNVQVTGLVLGLIAVAHILFKSDVSAFVSLIPLWLAFELKPQMTLSFLIFFFFFQKIQSIRILIFGAYVLLSHLVVEIMFVGDIHRLWIEKILRYSSNSLEEGYEISIWKSTAQILGHQPTIKVFTTVFTVLILILMVYFSLQSKGNLILFLATVFPLANSYLHLYDLAPIAILVVIAAFRTQGTSLILGCVLFLQIFPLSQYSQLVLALLFLLVAIWSYWARRSGLKFIVYVLVSSTLVAISFFIQRNLSQEIQIANSVVIPLIAVLALNSKVLISIFNPETIKQV